MVHLNKDHFLELIKGKNLKPKLRIYLVVTVNKIKIISKFSRIF